MIYPRNYFGIVLLIFWRIYPTLILLFRTFLLRVLYCLSRLQKRSVSWTWNCHLVSVRKLSMFFHHFIGKHLFWRLMILCLPMRDIEICMPVGREFNLIFTSEKSFKIVFISLWFCLSERLKARINHCRVN